MEKIWEDSNAKPEVLVLKNNQNCFSFVLKDNYLYQWVNGLWVRGNKIDRINPNHYQEDIDQELCRVSNRQKINNI